MMYFFRARYLPVSVDEIKKMADEFKIFAEVISRYAQPSHTHTHTHAPQTTPHTNIAHTTNKSYAVFRKAEH